MPEAPSAPPARSRYVLNPTAGVASRWSQPDAPARRQQLQRLAEQAALRQVPAAGLALIGLSALGGLVALWPDTAPAAAAWLAGWSAAVLALGGWLASSPGTPHALPRRLARRWGRWLHGDAGVEVAAPAQSQAPLGGHAAVLWVAAASALPVAVVTWLAPPDWRPLLALCAGLGAWAVALALHWMPLVAAPWVAVPLLAAMAVGDAAPQSVARLCVAAGLAVSIHAALACAAQRRAWTRRTWHGIVLSRRLREVKAQRDRAWRTDRDKSRFLAIASHDLRQPVHALGLFAATLLRRLNQTPHEPLVRNLVQGVDGLEQSFAALLDISRLDGGSLVAHSETFALRDMFRRLHMQYGGQAEFAGLALRFSPGGKVVTSDPQMLERIVGNLVQNAIKYTPSGGVAVVARTGKGCVRIEVWDTGRGIAAAALPRIFDEFYQAGRSERDRTQGLGMGLAIVKRLALLLGHQVAVVSTPGRGTVFSVSVPFGSLPGIQEEVAPSDTLPMTLSRPYLVLVVDDEEPIREGLRLLLQSWGLQAVTAADATQAEHAVLALEGRIDLVLSDYYLGEGADGLSLISRIRGLCGRRVPAVVITGDAALSAHTERPDVPVLIKPVQPRHLHVALCKALEQASA